MHEMTLIHERVRSLEKANQALTKRRRAKHTCIQAGDVLIIEDAQCLMAQKEKNKGVGSKRSAEGGASEAGPSAVRRCGRCGEAGHNIRTCQEVEKVTS